MKHVKLSEARERYSELLDEVAKGQTLIISPDMAPEVETALEQARIEERRKAIDEIRELRKGNKPVSIEEIIAWKNEGRL